MKSFHSQGVALFLAVLSLSSFATARSIRRDASAPLPYGNLTIPYNSTNATGTYANATGTYINATIPAPPPLNTPTLLPAVHWEHPVGDIQNLAPINSTDLYYSHNAVSDPSVKHLFAQLSTTLRYQAVVLEHSSFVQNISCSADGILVDFTSPEAFQFAASSWPEVNDFVLVTYTNGCGATQDQRTFWLIDDLDLRNNTNSILAVVKNEIAVEDALNSVHMIWGTYHPPGINSTNTTSPPPTKRSFDHANPSITKSADINLFPPADSGAPWPNAFKVFSDSGSKGNASATIDLYCVDCGVKGHVTVAGSADFRIFPPKLEALNANINANIQAGLKVGLEATASFSETKTKNLLNQAIPDLGFTVAKVFSAGVFLTIDATATLEIDAEAQILVGVTANLPNFEADLNLLDEDSAGKSKVTGYQPQWDKTFEAKGSVNAKATVALPVGLNLGIEISAINWKKTAALIEQPSIVGQVTAAGSLGSGGPASDTCNDGLEYSVNAVNDISLNLFDIKTFSLEHYESPDLIHGCEQLPGAKTTSATATTRTSSASDDKTTSTHVSAKPTGSANHTVHAGTGVSGKPTGYANHTVHAGTGVSGRPTGYANHTVHAGTGVSGRPTGHANHTVPVGTGRVTGHGSRPAYTGTGIQSYGSKPTGSGSNYTATITGTGSPATRTHATLSTLSTKTGTNHTTLSTGRTETSSSVSEATATTGDKASSTGAAATTTGSSSSLGLPSYGGSPTSAGDVKSSKTTSSYAESTTTKASSAEYTTTKSSAAETTTSHSTSSAESTTTAAPTTTSKAETTTTTTTTTKSSTSTKESTPTEEETSPAKTSKAAKPAKTGSYGSGTY